MKILAILIYWAQSLFQDGEADMFGIDFVKIASHEAAQKYEVNSIPALVYFR